MPVRIEIAYLLIALLVAAAIFGIVKFNQYRREQRRIARGGRPRR